ncbi:hypothetical protein B7C62_25090 [Kitasatospora albolonga]|uniref:Secreted protein n=1 Tax=Kitasatospora albolonga TaxID=68173 RepID=A0ABC8BXH7_9ACTN|nr:hypothetical protein B7C62_25090 [Kitasatospora albolonga]
MIHIFKMLRLLRILRILRIAGQSLGTTGPVATALTSVGFMFAPKLMRPAIVVSSPPRQRRSAHT